MDRRRFISAASATAIGAALPAQVFAQTAEPPIQHRLPATDPDYKRSQSYIEEAPVHQYHWASDRAVEDFKDMKFGLSMESNQAGSVHLLGYSRELARRWDTGQGLTITLPEDLQQEANRPCQFAWCFRIASAKTA